MKKHPQNHWQRLMTVGTIIVVHRKYVQAIRNAACRQGVRVSAIKQNGDIYKVTVLK
jgi:hypothetical protein